MRLWILPAAMVLVAIIVAAATPAAAGDLKLVRSTSTETMGPLPGAAKITCSGSLPIQTSSVIVSYGVGSHGGKYVAFATVASCQVTPEFVFVEPYSTVQTNANGDQVYYFGNIYVNLATGALTGDYEITGGTGNFAGATGSGELVGTVDLTTGFGTNSSVGMISTVGSGK